VANRRTKSKNKNRKKKPASPGFIFPTPLASILVLVALLCLSYLWLCGRTEALGMQIKRLENEKAKVERRIANEEYKWSIMISPQHLQAALDKHNLDMQWPEDHQVVMVSNPSWYLDDGRPQGSRTQYASRSEDVARP